MLEGPCAFSHPLSSSYKVFLSLPPLAISFQNLDQTPFPSGTFLKSPGLSLYLNVPDYRQHWIIIACWHINFLPTRHSGPGARLC